MLGKISAWGALAVGALFAALAALQLTWGLMPWVTVGIAALLLVGGVRTLRQMSGGLRMLAGAWGVVAGMTIQPFVFPPNDCGCSFAVVIGAFSYLFAWFFVFALAGLALTVLHKEKKA